MTELLTEDRTFKSDLFSSIPLGSEGGADGCPSISEVTTDAELAHDDWPTNGSVRRMGRHILGSNSENIEAVASYGYTVYRALLEEEEPLDAVYLDPRCFLPETDLIDVLEQTVKHALDDDRIDLVKPTVTGMVHTAQGDNFAGDKMRKYIDTIMSSGDLDAIKVYVEFMNANTIKSSESSKTFLKRIAHAIRELPDNPDRTTSIDRLNKQLLLEDVGHAWIRKAMPVAEIDWLP